eukprot:COSAG02_NODE_16953_length_1040_cov_2.580234_1_plen_194_part_01
MLSGADLVIVFRKWADELAALGLLLSVRVAFLLQLSKVVRKLRLPPRAFFKQLQKRCVLRLNRADWSPCAGSSARSFPVALASFAQATSSAPTVHRTAGSGDRYAARISSAVLCTAGRSPSPPSSSAAGRSPSPPSSSGPAPPTPYTHRQSSHRIAEHSEQLTLVHTGASYINTAQLLGVILMPPAHCHNGYHS